MKIDFEGRIWQFDMDDIGTRQGEKIAAYTGGLSPAAWYNTLPEIEAPGWLKSVECLYWLMNEQNGTPVTLGAPDFKPLKLFLAFADAQKDNPPAEGEPGPTQPAGPPLVTGSPAG